MQGLSKNMLIGALLLGCFAIFGSGLLAFINSMTEKRIAENERQALLNSLNQVIDASQYDNALEEDSISVNANTLNRDEASIVYRARKNNKAVAAIMTVTAPDGYNGKIKMLVAVNTNGKVAGVRVVAHKETPGLGDKIDVSRDNWINSFSGKSLQQPNINLWTVKKDGGEFDSFSGATITPRAVVKAVKNSLQYFENNQDLLFQ